MMERGVVFSAYEVCRLEGLDGFQTGAVISDLDLNYLTLYWDRLVSPTNNILHRPLNNERDLITCGILTRPKFFRPEITNSAEIPDFYTDTHVKTLSALRNKEVNVDWRMHFLNDQINISPELATKKEVLRFELGNLLPVPMSDTPINEILEFKERRSDELAALHEYIDELYKEVLLSCDFNLQKAKAMSGLKKSIEDLHKLNDQFFRSPVKFNISSSFELNMTQIYTGFTTIASAIQNPHPLEALSVGAVVTMLGGFVTVKPQFQSVIKGGDKKLAYLTKARREGVI